MRDIVLTLVIFSSLPFIFRRPFYGLVMFTWLAYMRAPDLCWGFAREIPFSKIVAIVMFLGFFLQGGRKFYVPVLRNHLLTLLTVLVVLSVFINFLMSGMAHGKYLEFAKIVLIAVFTVTIVDDQWKLRVMAWTVALSLGFYGAKCGIFGFLGGEVFQGPGGLLLDNNDFSLAMVMNLPFLFYLAMEERNETVKIFLRVVAICTVATIVATHSRGGFLALALVYLMITMKSKYKVLGLSVAVFAGILFIIFIPEEYVERLKSITDVKEASAASRLVAWKVAFLMIKSNPIWGVGLGNFQYNYMTYAPDTLKGYLYATGRTGGHVAHNSYLQIWAEAGSLAFIVFLILIAITLYKIRTLRKQNRRSGGPTWITHYTNMFEVSIYGYLVGATFLNRGQFDLIYQIVGLCTAMAIIAAAQSRTEAEESGPPVLTVRSKDGYLIPKGIP
jgi:probable O-glycosylation ligase (exosortase A-associated)